MFNVIGINAYKVPLGGNNELHQEWKRYIQNNIDILLQSCEIEKFDLYTLQNDIHQFKAGKKNKRIVAYANGTFNGASKESYADETGLTINGVKFEKIKSSLPYVGEDNYHVVKSEEGIAIAEYDKNGEELNFLVDVFNEFEDKNRKLFNYIMQNINEIFKARKMENSWVHTSNKEALTERFMHKLREQKERELRDSKNQIDRYEHDIETYKRQLKQMWDNLLRIRRNIGNEEEYLKSVSDQFIKDLDLIAKHPKVSDLHIVDGKIEMYTTDIYAYNKKGERFYIGQFKVSMNLENTDVKFFNLNNRRNGFWTSQDHHPHVNGSNGQACLGSVASTIAELASQSQAYALALICIDFLENANIEDPAGAKVYNWDMVDGEGKVIIKGGGVRHSWSCEICERQMTDDDERYNVICEVDDDGETTDVRTMCENCMEETAHWSDDRGEYVHNDISDDDEDDEDED